MKQKVMFINAINPTREVESIFPPLGLGYLASSLRQEFGFSHFEFKIVDRNVEECIAKFNPDIVGISSVTPNYNWAIKYAEIAKKYDLPVIVGGPHITALPSTLTENMDVAVIGEGEETIVDLFYLFEERGFLDKDKLEKIPGIAFRKNGKLIVTRRRNPIQPLDKIPMPARDLLTIRKYTNMITSRGCPYKCSFCFSSRFWEGVRFFSAEYVVAEIEHLIKKYNVKEIEFSDDLFVANKRRIKQIIKMLDEKGILGKVSFRCNARANLVDDDLVRLLKRMNVKWIYLGLESGCPSTLEFLKGRNITVEDNLRAVKIINKYRIRSYASFIIGSPKEDRKGLLQTLRFIKNAPLAGFDIYLLTPYPGTPIWDYAYEKGLVSENMDWDILNQNFAENYANAIILSEKLTKEELFEFYLRFRREQVKKVARRILKYPSEIPKMAFRVLSKVLSGKSIID